MDARFGGDNARFDVTHPDLFRRACEWLVMEQPRDRVEMMVGREGLEAEEARALVAQALASTRGERRGEGRDELSKGIGLLATGVVLTIAGSTLLQGLGAPFFILFTGMIGYGGFLVVSGLKKLSG